MATPTLTRDNHKIAFGAQKDGLAGINSSSGSHLVVVKQRTNWSNKEFVVTPTETKYCQSWSLGQESFPNQQGGPQVYNDTNILINNVKNAINNAAWKTGDCAIFTVESRSGGPYAYFNSIAHPDYTMPSPENLTEYGASVVAYKFNLRHLHFSKMSSFTAYLRVWGASIAGGYPSVLLPDDGIIYGGTLFGNAGCLRAKFYDSLPTVSSEVAENADSFEFAGVANNGIQVSTDTFYYDTFVCYNPFGGLPCYDSLYGNNARVYTKDKNFNQPATNYYHDFQLSNQTNLNFLKNNPGECWLAAHFHMGNGFASSTQYLGLFPLQSVTLFAERIELVFKCTGTKFNA